MTENLRERIRKIQALAERGVGGEKETAEKKLKSLLAANNMTEEDLVEEETHYYLFSYSGGEYRKKLLGQIIYKVLGHEQPIRLYHSKGTRNKYGVYCTPAQKIEIDLDFEFYCNIFEKEIDIFLTAFIQKQELFPQDCPTDHIDLNDMTPEQKNELRKMRAFANSIDKRSRSSALLEDLNAIS